MREIERLIEAVRNEAVRADFPVDRVVYTKASRDPGQPVLYAGSLSAPVCFLGRDLGKDEVAVGQPLVGAGGRLIRSGIFEAKNGEPPPKADKRVESVLESVLLTNTVPYKPPGNKAYSAEVKERFRPYVAELLARFWQGDTVITLGTEAFFWFTPYAEPAGELTLNEFWARDDRYEAILPCKIRVERNGEVLEKAISVAPLPHPSPLNRRWLPLLPELLRKRLAGKVW